MWTRAYWQTVAERVIGGMAAGVLSVLGLDGSTSGTVEATPKTLGLAVLFGGLTALAVSLISTPAGAQGTPFITKQPASAIEPPAPGDVPPDGGGHVYRDGGPVVPRAARDERMDGGPGFRPMRALVLAVAVAASFLVPITAHADPTPTPPAPAGCVSCHGTAAVPTVQPAGTANHNGIVVPAPRAGLLPIGRTTAGAVPLTSPIPAADRIPADVLAKIVPKAMARPYGAEIYGRTFADGSTSSCSSALNAEAPSGSAYLITAGHCTTAGIQPTPTSYTYPAGGAVMATSARSNYDATGDHSAIRMNYDQDPAKWRGSDGAIRTVAGAGNPVVNETVQSILAQSNQTIVGTIISTTTCTTFAQDPPGTPAHCNLAVAQSAVGPCIQPGDSGSAVNDGFDVVGIAVAGFNYGGHCLIYMDRIGSTLQAYGLFPG